MSSYELKPDGTADLLVPTKTGTKRLTFTPDDAKLLATILAHVLKVVANAQS